MEEVKKVIITGVSGQDGSYMADYLLENTPHEIYGMVRRSASPNYSNIKEALKNPRFKLITGDLSDSQSIDKVVEKIRPHYFINLAAQSFVGSSWELPEQTMDVNATGVMRCLESIVRYVPNCRFYNAGSSEEFGDVLYDPQDEKHPLRARSPYGVSKISARQVVKTYRESYNLYAVQGYLFNHESPRRGEEFVTRKITKGVARIYHALKNNEPLEKIRPIELGNLESRRDWSHAKDFVRGIWMMLNQDKYIKEYVLSSNETHTVKEFVEKSFLAAEIEGDWKNNGFWIPYSILNETKETIDINMYDLEVVKVNPIYNRPADVNVLLGNSNLAREELKWAPKYTFDQLIEEMVKSDIESYK